MTTFRDDMSPLVAVWHSLNGGTFLINLVEDEGPGRRSGAVLDDDGNRIGTASDSLYGGRGFSVWTRPFAGYVPESQIEFV